MVTPQLWDKQQGPLVCYRKAIQEWVFDVLVGLALKLKW